MNEDASQVHSSCAVGPSASYDRRRNAGHLIQIKRPALGFAKRQTYHRLSLWTVMASVVRFIKETELGSVFDDQTTKVMGEAFDAACKVLDETGQSSVNYEAVAKCIIEIAKSGERDPNQLRDRALATLRSQTAHTATTA
jgi:hypothetical protein